MLYQLQELVIKKESKLKSKSKRMLKKAEKVVKETKILLK